MSDTYTVLHAVHEFYNTGAADEENREQGPRVDWNYFDADLLAVGPLGLFVALCRQEEAENDIYAWQLAFIPNEQLNGYVILYIYMKEAPLILTCPFRPLCDSV